MRTKEKNLLIVDDCKEIRASLKAVFSRTYQLSMAESVAEAEQLLSEKVYDLILLDIIMPDRDGMEFLQQISASDPDIPVIMVSGVSDTRKVVEAIQLGAFDYITKPFDLAEIRHMVRRALNNTNMQRRLEILEDQVSQEFPVAAIVGESPVFQKKLSIAKKTAQTDSTVLICGESGTGKELIARLLHNESDRCDEPFIAVHCAALSENLMESELFGHEKGAFTHAEKRKLGRFDLAGSGTLFFDEVSEMTLGTQVKLLRVLQEREFMRVGGTQLVQSSARIIAASAKDLQVEVKAGRFRSDLFYRLSVVPIELPPLRDRPDDIPMLARHFLKYFRQKMNVATMDFSPEVLEVLGNHSWPGNVRELKNIIERVLVLNGSSTLIQMDDLPPELQSEGGQRERIDCDGLTLAAAVNQYECGIIRNALNEAKGVQTHAAKLLGTTRRILKYRMEKLEINN